jgi:sugar lactone lactonase YvrE
MDDQEESASGCFWRWDGQELTKFHGDMVVTNGPASSHDGQTLYTTDTTKGMIYAHNLGDGLPGEPSRFARFEEGWGHPDGMTVDAEGHVWVCHWGGSRITRFAPDGSVERIVPVPTAQVTKCAFGGPDMTTLYTTDTTNGMIYAHVFGDGLPGEPSRFARFEEGWGHPDGMTVDAEGHVWVCHWGGSRITRFAPDGSVERILPVPTAQVTKCAFGGPGMTTLYITTASIGRDPAIDLMAGHLFAVETGIKGQQSHIFGA